MKVLIVGATGATGKWVVKHLIEEGHKVKAIVRSPEILSSFIGNSSNIEIIKAAILDLSDEDLTEHVKECDAVVSCLGHNLNLKGIYGKPRRLVTDAVKNLCTAIIENKSIKPIKLILMNTSGNKNKDLIEKRTIGEKVVIGLVSFLLPPQADNEQAAEFLRTEIGQKHPQIEWVAVRPDGLFDEDKVSQYSLHESPTRSPIFNAGKTSRINVAHFMKTLILDESIWEDWKGRMPVVYNVEI